MVIFTEIGLRINLSPCSFGTSLDIRACVWLMPFYPLMWIINIDFSWQLNKYSETFDWRTLKTSARSFAWFNHGIVWYSTYFFMGRKINSEKSLLSNCWKSALRRDGKGLCSRGDIHGLIEPISLKTARSKLIHAQKQRNYEWYPYLIFPDFKILEYSIWNFLIQPFKSLQTKIIAY